MTAMSARMYGADGSGTERLQVEKEKASKVGKRSVYYAMACR